LPEKFNRFKERTRKECEKGNPLTVQLNEAEEQIHKCFVENCYDNVDKKDDITARLAEKIETDDEVAKSAMEFYRSLAENCNADAQYALGKLYLDSRFLDMPQAVRWLEYAAYQGHRDAVYELENLEIDDDGRHDAWI
jgi:TPR repeat protein